MTEEQAYEQAFEELHKNTISQGTWIKAIAHSEGDETKARALYLKLRAEQLLNADATQRKQQRNEKIAKDLKDVAGFTKTALISVLKGVGILLAVVIFFIILAAIARSGS